MMGTPARIALRPRRGGGERQSEEPSRRFSVGDRVKVGHEENIRDARIGQVTAVKPGGYYVAIYIGETLRNQFFVRSQVHAVPGQSDNEQNEEES